MSELVYKILESGTTALPNLILQHYTQIGLKDEEMMLIIHLLSFKTEGNLFPTIHQLEQRMSGDTKTIVMMLQRLVQQNYLSIEEDIDPKTGIRSEWFCFVPLHKKIVAFLEDTVQKVQRAEFAGEITKSLYTVFEEEFGRPLSPIECENIAMWLDQDGYTEALIVAALREAVMSGKLFFRYIDRILFEWHRNNIRTPQQAREYSLKFRKHQKNGIFKLPVSPAASGEVPQKFPFYNWLEDDGDS
ncbi:DnaD domain-containing protein [Aneurinibacillus terranovensis]|uniref:DnaD domain-containing protein n=1 Tax=Aneurinibacillus terranovensis TaxID=278991 RepID=UPI00041C6B15|nr:DnaD domain-containing protein [Aneurinibacillus terranovensis]